MVAVMQPLARAWPVEPRPLCSRRDRTHIAPMAAAESRRPGRFQLRPALSPTRIRGRAAPRSTTRNHQLLPRSAPTPSGGAFTSFEEGFKGTLDPGMVADLQVYAEDPLELSPDKWPALRPRLVALAGRPVTGSF